MTTSTFSLIFFYTVSVLLAFAMEDNIEHLVY